MSSISNLEGGLRIANWVKSSELRNSRSGSSYTTLGMESVNYFDICRRVFFVASVCSFTQAIIQEREEEVVNERRMWKEKKRRDVECGWKKGR